MVCVCVRARRVQEEVRANLEVKARLEEIRKLSAELSGQARPGGTRRDSEGEAAEGERGRTKRERKGIWGTAAAGLSRACPSALRRRRRSCGGGRRSDPSR